MSKKPKQWLIDPNKSAMENTWDAAKTAAAFLLRRIKLKCTKEEWHDIYDEMVLKGVRNFIDNKILRHTYDRRFCFFQNVLSSVWSVSNGCIYRNIRDNKRRITALSVETETHDFATIGDTIEDTGRHPLYYTEWFYQGNRAIPILTNAERERFGLRGARLSVEPDKVFEALCVLADEDAELSGTPITNDEYERRDEIRKRLDTLPKDSYEKRHKREHMREYRQRKKMEKAAR